MRKMGIYKFWKNCEKWHSGRLPNRELWKFGNLEKEIPIEHLKINSSLMFEKLT